VTGPTPAPPALVIPLPRQLAELPDCGAEGGEGSSGVRHSTPAWYSAEMVERGEAGPAPGRDHAPALEQILRTRSHKIILEERNCLF